MSDEPRTYSRTSGRLRNSTIDPREFRCRGLAAELADLWLRSARALNWEVVTASGRASAVRSFVRHVDASPLPAESSLFGRADDLGPQLVDWQARTREDGNRGHANAVRALIRRAHFERNDLQPTLQYMATEVASKRPNGVTSVPLDEYTNSERIAQTRAATESIRLAELRVERGIAFYNSNPVVQHLVAMALEEPRFIPVLSELRRHPQVLAEVESITGVDLKGRGHHALHQAVSALGSLIGPTRIEQLSFRILIQWATGVAPEQVRECRISDLIFGSDGVHWRSDKNRSAKTIPMKFEGTEPWRVAGLFKRAIALTSLFREISGSDHVFVSYTVQSTTTSAMHVGLMARSKPGLADWLKRHEINSSAPHDLRRIRKAHTAVRIGVAPTPELMKQPDHSASTFGKHYDSTTTTLVRSGSIIVRAQDRLIRHIDSRRGTVVSGSSEKLAKDTHTDTEIRQLAHEVTNQSSVERSLGASTCADPRNSPFAKSGTWCESAPFTCMLCPNAVIFDDHAPQLLLMKRALTDQRTAIAPDEYARQIYPVVTAIEGYLEQIDAGVLERAAAAVAGGSETFVTPLTKRVSL